MRVRPPLAELTVCRAKEFLREPEALFWVFAFPVLLAIALGLAFREKGPDRIPVGVVAASPADPAAGRVLAALARSPALLPHRFSAAEGGEALRTGRISLLVEAGPPLLFRFDETRPDSRIARLEADDALQRAAGRRQAVPVSVAKVTEKGSRYIDFLIPGLLGMNLMGTGIWSLAFSVTTGARTSSYMRWAEILVSTRLIGRALLISGGPPDARPRPWSGPGDRGGGCRTRWRPAAAADPRP